MREDLNKLLTERERYGHRQCFHDVRNSKNNATFDEDSVGGKMSIHSHRRQGTTKTRRKTFSDKLNPLRGFLRENVGRPWNKVYSELNETFDRRKFMNDHVFDHVFDYVELNAKMIDGKVCVLNSYRSSGREYDYKTKRYITVETGYYDKRWIPVKEDSCEWYVHPVDGLLKANLNKVSKKSRQLENRKARERAEFAVFRSINKYTELHKVDGIWYVYTLKDRPAKVEQVTMPTTWTYDFIARQRWQAMSKTEQREIGQITMVSPPINEIGSPLGRSHANLYYAERNTASSKILKQHDLIGDAEEPEVQQMSARERSKYRKAA